jgi:UDP-4-amino-4,6-dideoxy-N-acetyl-beta-L-altrosamine N-acetyltransferase
MRFTSDEIHLKPMQQGDLEMVLAWRNHESIRKEMISQTAILMDDHVRWYEQCVVDIKRLLLVGYLDSGEPVGFVQFSSLEPSTASQWGFYRAPELSNSRGSTEVKKGLGTAMCAAALSHVFERQLTHKVCGQVIATNTRSADLHLRLGFANEGVLRQQHRINGRLTDLYCYGLLSDEWQRPLGSGQDGRDENFEL